MPSREEPRSPQEGAPPEKGSLPEEGAVAPAVELRGIDKRFGAVHANRDVGLAVAPGTIHGIVGENGAGKSTLMNVLYGFYRADRGEIRIAGRPVAIEDSEDAIAAGIGMVHQHFMLVDTFTVAENVILGVEGGALLAAGAERAQRELARLAREYALEVPPDALAGDLPVGLQQRVEILKALYRGAGILILDEPTGALTPPGGGPPVPYPPPAQGTRQGGHPDHPQAARDHGGDRSGLGHAPGQDGGPPRHRRDHHSGAWPS